MSKFIQPTWWHRFGLAALTIFVGTNAVADTPGKQMPPKNGMIKVAVVLSEGATVIDFAGPWEVFQDTTLADDRGNDITPFELYTVAPSKTPVHTTGSNRPGITVTPDYSFADAPTPDIVVIGAQSGGPGLSAWLQKVHADHKVIVSVCTGAFKVAKAGLLNGKEATTHHWYFDNFASAFPNVKLVRDVRYVEADPITFTAGGLTSGVDLALHIVADYFGDAVAQQTADYMEYQGSGWKSNKGISELSVRVKHQEWSGNITSDVALLMHVVTTGANAKVTTDIPGQHKTGIPTTVHSNEDKVSMTFQIAGHPATFVGRANSDGTAMSGTYTQDGKSFPLTLVQKPITAEATH